MNLRSALEGERKQVTVLFADVKNSLELAEQLGIEDWHRALDRLFYLLADAVHRFEGTVNQYTGDGMMALFGAPIAHEDHAQRACRAALRIADGVRGYGDEFQRNYNLVFRVRMGLNSGEVVVGKIGDDLRMDYTAQGRVVGLAARMEELAAPGCIYLTDRVERLVRGFFQLEELGALSPAGSSETIEAYELHGEGSARTRLDLQDRTERSGLVGRGSAMATLESALADARKGKGLVLAVEGAPGVGKSRLCLEFALRCREQGHAVCEVHCPPHGRTLPHFALYELARSLIGFDAGDSLGEVKRRIRSRLAPLGEDDPEVVRILSEALSEPDLPSDSGEGGEAGRSVQTLGAADNAKRLAAILLRVFERIQARAAFVVLIDDLHWIDPDSEAFLARLAVLAETGRTLLLVNFRPEYEPLWTEGRRFRQLGLGPLDRASSYALIEERIGNDRSLADLPSHIHSKAGGNPLFIEELIRSLVEAGKLMGRVGEYRSVETPEPLEIPDTIQALVAARIDRLQERDKQVLQVAAVIGKSFSQPVLARMVDCPEDALADSLQELHRVEFIQGETQLESLSFVHPLTQEVAYRSLLAERRKELHGRAARALVEVGERLGQSAALIAHHFEEAGRLWQARRWRQRARLLVTNIVPSGALREPDKK